MSTRSTACVARWRRVFWAISMGHSSPNAERRTAVRYFVGQQRLVRDLRADLTEFFEAIDRQSAEASDERPWER